MNSNNNFEDRASELKGEVKFNNTVIQVRMGDLTEEKVDVIVNAANCKLDHMSGVAGKIVEKGGHSIQTESNSYVFKNGELFTGEVVETGAGKLPCKSVFHAVGPIWNSSQIDHEEDIMQLQWCISNSLSKAEEKKYTSISIPAISSGIFGFPKELCAKILFEEAIKYVTENKNTVLREIRFTNFDLKTVDIFINELKNVKNNHGI
eukprot:TRINITY_DN4973_c0_g1_i1.p1 TRINITY_DN4973_c0_g1~~TRINITY_DN4973_c0_g1_i1.p1  ORF type:complete len:206 (-),score=61.64 TRINITY_DN4973_c0_g1_i1:70-687(-)